MSRRSALGLNRQMQLKALGNPVSPAIEREARRQLQEDGRCILPGPDGERELMCGIAGLLLTRWERGESASLKPYEDDDGEALAYRRTGRRRLLDPRVHRRWVGGEVRFPSLICRKPVAQPMRSDCGRLHGDFQRRNLANHLDIQKRT